MSTVTSVSRRDGPLIAGRPRRVRPVTDLVRLLPYLLPYRTRWVAMVAVALLSLVATIAIPLLIKAVIDGPVHRRDSHGLWILGTAALAVGIAEAMLWFIRRWLVARATMGVETDIRKDLYARLQILPMSFHGRWQSGQLLSRTMNDLATVRRLLSFGLIMLGLNVIQIVAVTALLLRMYWPLGVVVLVAVVPVAVTTLRFERVFTSLSRRAQDEAGHLATAVEETALGIRTIKSFGREDHVRKQFDAQARGLYATQIRKVAVSARFWTLLEVIPNLALISVLGLGAYAAGHGSITMGTLVAFITMMMSLVWPVASLGYLIAMAQEAMTAANRIAEIFDEPVAITDGPGSQRPGSGRLEFDGVGFRFPDAGSDEWVLRGVSLVLEPGETLALVGATGSGKSALAALVPRLYDVTEGRILIDGSDIRELSLSVLRSVVAVAFEDPILFSMSVAENLTLSHDGTPSPDGAAPTEDAELADAIAVAAAGFVYDLPFGIQTRIGEQGMSLSGGQRQRLALARAILARPRILVLDDTLSALDVHTEAVVTEALRRVLAGVTGIVVAHRASTVLLADRVAVLGRAEGGGHTISHIGTHEELLATVPGYRYLLAADDELDDGCEPRPVWTEDDARRQQEHGYQEASESHTAAGGLVDPGSR